MSNKVVSILGCGWLGKSLGTKLSEEGYVVKGSTTKLENVSALRDAGIIPFVLRVDESLMDDSSAGFFDADVLVISLPQRVRAGKAYEYIEQIRYVVKAAQTGNARNIILLSTTSVYPKLNGVVTENDADPQNPVTQAEAIVRESGIPSTIVRFAGLFGPGRHPGNFLAGRRDVAGDNTPVNLIHLDDCVEIIKCIIKNNIWNEVLNACADDHPTRKLFYTQAAIELGLQPPNFLNDSEAHYHIVSNTRLKSVLNYKFIQPLMSPPDDH